MPCFSASDRKKAHVFSQPSSDRAKTAHVFSQPSSNRSKTAVSSRSICETRMPAYALKKESSYNPCTAVFYTQKIVPKVQQKGHKTTLQPRELDRLKNAAKVVTYEERLDALMKREEASQLLELEAAKKKLRFKEMDDARKKAEADMLKGAGSEIIAEKMKILDRAFLAKQEQEEEVQWANRVILDAKCHAVRDAQVQEKFELNRERKHDDERLERIVMDNAMKALKEEDEKYSRHMEEKQKYAEEIKRQLHHRNTSRFLEAERIEEEAAILRKANAALKRDEERERHEAHERRMKYRQDLSQVVEMSNEFRRILWQQEKESEMRIAAYMKEKEEHLRALQREAKLAKEEFERKQQRIYNLAEKVLISRSDREEMAYLREQEKNEREYRQKERAAALRKKQIERELAEARDRQKQETKYRQALQIARAEKDFNTLIDRLKQDAEKERKEQAERLRRRDLYRRDIVQQMGNNEMERRRLKDLEKQQADAWRERERQREANIQAVINAKLEAMKDACLPPKYISDVEKQLVRVAGRAQKLR